MSFLNKFLNKFKKMDFELCEAAKDGNIEKIRSLVASGVNINARDENDRTAIMLLIINNELTPEILRFFIAHGADIKATEKNDVGGENVFMMAVNSHSFSAELFEIFMQNGIDINERSYFLRETALMISARWGRLTPDMLNLFIQHGSDINAKNTNGETALMLLLIKGYLTPELLCAFVQNGIDLNSQNKNGRTLLMYAAGHGYLTESLLDAFVSNGADINLQDNNGYTALTHMAYWKSITPEMLDAFAEQFIRLETPLNEMYIQCVRFTDIDNSADVNKLDSLITRVLVERLNTNPNEVIDFIKNTDISRRFEEWVDKGTPRINELLSKVANRLSWQLKNKDNNNNVPVSTLTKTYSSTVMDSELIFF